MRWFKAVLALSFISLFFLIPSSSKAFEKGSVTIINPIRGKDFWSHNFSPLQTPQNQYELINKYNLPATWLVRYDALTDDAIDGFLKNLNAQQEIGLFFEVTPSLTKAAGVNYNKSSSWHLPGSVFLSGYSPADRIKLIDAAMSKFKSVFGYYPKSVGAWWIDAYSLTYLHDKYGVTANLDVSDQYSTDGYQVWGQYYSEPFYPSKFNALMPAQSIQTKIGLITLQWATRDPFNAYGSGTYASTYSVQANDYLLRGLNYTYFQKILNIYLNSKNTTLNQVTVGIENDFSWDKVGSEYSHQLQIIKDGISKGTFDAQTMAGFSQRYQSVYPNISPNILISASDPLGSNGKVIWYMTPRYRFGLFYQNNQTKIRDLRLFNDSNREKCYQISCQNLDMALWQNEVLDDVTFQNGWLLDDGKISHLSTNLNQDTLTINYQTEAGLTRQIKLLPNDISVNNKIQPISFAILNAVQSQKNLNPNKESNFHPQFDYFSFIKTFFLDSAKFILLTFFFFFLPGWFLTGRKLLSIPVGWSVFTLLSFVFGYLNLSWMIWILPLVGLIQVKKIYFDIKSTYINIKQNVLLIVIILSGSVTWLATIFRSGLVYSYGLSFWGPNGHDAIWHLGLISALKKEIPPQNPFFSGVYLHNYHYFFDLLIARSSQLFQIDEQDLFFRLFPICFSLLGGLLLYQVVNKYWQNKAASLATIFLFYFGGSFGWIVSYLKDRTIGGESAFWSQQAISTLLNPPFAISLILLFVLFLIFYELERKRSGLFLLFSFIIVGGTLIEFKVYAGLLFLGGLGVVSLFRLIKQKETDLIKVFVLCLGLSLLVFLPNNLGSNQLVVWSPLWLVNSMIDFPDRLGWQRLSLARQAYFATGSLYKLLEVEIAGLAFFIFGNLGTRALGLFKIKDIYKDLKENNLINIFLWSIFGGGIIISLLFIQKGNDWNIIQFFYYSQTISCIFGGIVIGSLLKRWKNISNLIFLIVILLFTLPTTYGTLGNYLPIRPPAELPKDEISALNFLKMQPQGIVLTQPFDQKFKQGLIEPIPLYAYTSTGYVAAYSGHPVFLEDLINLNILGIDYNSRLNLSEAVLNEESNAKDILRNNDIKYIYILKSIPFQEDDGKLGTVKIFDNPQVEIFKVI